MAARRRYPEEAQPAQQAPSLPPFQQQPGGYAAPQVPAPFGAPQPQPPAPGFPQPNPGYVNAGTPPPSFPPPGQQAPPVGHPFPGQMPPLLQTPPPPQAFPPPQPAQQAPPPGVAPYQVPPQSQPPPQTAPPPVNAPPKAFPPGPLPGQAPPFAPPQGLPQGPPPPGPPQGSQPPFGIPPQQPPQLQQQPPSQQFPPRQGSAQQLPSQQPPQQFPQPTPPQPTPPQHFPQQPPQQLPPQSFPPPATQPTPPPQQFPGPPPQQQFQPPQAQQFQAPPLQQQFQPPQAPPQFPPQQAPPQQQFQPPTITPAGPAGPLPVGQPPVAAPASRAPGRRAYPEEQLQSATQQMQNMNLNTPSAQVPPTQAPQFYTPAAGPAVPSPYAQPPPTGPSAGQGYPPPPTGAYPTPQQQTSFGAQPPAEQELYRVSPESQCPPKFMRMTINAIPQTTGLLTRSSIPFGAVIHPMASSDPEEVPVIDFGSVGIIRCRRCRAYINPFVMFTEAGRRWRCNLCSMINDVPNEYVVPLDANGRRVDHHLRKELNYGCIEFVAPLEYTVRPPMPPVYFFVIDVSYYAVISGMLDAAVNTIRAHLRDLPGAPRTQIGFLTFDNTVHFYSLKSTLTKPQMMVVPDIDDLFLPVPDDLLVNLNDSMHVVESLLDNLSATFQSNQRVESALGPALRAAYGVMKNVGGKMVVFQSSLPSIGVASLKNREGPKPAVDKELALLRPADQFYKVLALDCSRQQISVDLFLMPPGYVDVATLSSMSQFTGGQVFYYPPGELQQKIEKFRRDLSRDLTRPTGFEAVMRVRCGKGLRVQTHFGNHFIKSTDLLALPNIDSDKAFAVQLDLTEGLSSLKHVSLQAALLYTSTTGERRIRALNLCLPVTSQLSDLYKYADVDAIMNLTAKMAIERALNASKLSEAREAVLNQCIDALVEYRNNFAKGSPTLATPPTLHLLPLYTFALIKNVVIRAGEIRSDERSYAMSLLRTMPVFLSEPFIYPRLFCVSNFPPHVGLPDPSTGAIALPPLLELQSENVARDQAYLLDDGQSLYLWIGKLISSEFLVQVFGVHSFDALETDGVVPNGESPIGQRLTSIINYLRSQRPLFQRLFVIKEADGWEYKFTSLLIYDRTKAFSTTYPEFLRELQKLVASKSTSR